MDCFTFTQTKKICKNHHLRYTLNEYTVRLRTMLIRVLLILCATHGLILEFFFPPRFADLTFNKTIYIYLHSFIGFFWIPHAAHD